MPGDVLVAFDEQLTTDAINAVLQQHNVTPVAPVVTLYSARGTKAVLVKTDPELSPEEAIARLEADDAVKYAQPNYIYHPEADSAASASGAADTPGWHHKKINTLGAWEYIEDTVDTYRASEVLDWVSTRVRVVSIGESVDPEHSDLTALPAGNMNFDDALDFSMDDLGLPGPPPAATNAGTHTAGIVGATTHTEADPMGVASGPNNSYVELIPYNIYDNDTRTTTSAKLAKAIVHAVSPGGAKVINLAVGDTNADDQLLENAVAHADKQSVLIVVPAGDDDSTGPHYPGDFSQAYPDTVISVISLTNVDYTDSSVNPRAEGSNYGSGKTLSAPGANIYSTLAGDTYGYMSGTTGAAAVVSGVAALMLYVNPDLNGNIQDIADGRGQQRYRTVSRQKLAGLRSAPSEAKAPNVLTEVEVLAPEVYNTSYAKLSWKKVQGASGYYVYTLDATTGVYRRLATVSSSTAAIRRYTTKKLPAGNHRFIIVPYVKNGGIISTANPSESVELTL